MMRAVLPHRTHPVKLGSAPLEQIRTVCRILGSLSNAFPEAEVEVAGGSEWWLG